LPELKKGRRLSGAFARADGFVCPVERTVMVTRRLRSTLATCTALAVLSLACGAAAQQATQPQTDTTLKPIVLKGKRVKAGDPESTPLATQTTETQIENKQIRSIEDLGRAIDPGVNFSRATNSLNIRGLEGSRVTTLVDGIPLTYLRDNARSNNGGADAIDFFALTTVNVVKGGDSSRLGDGALGGALLVRTLEPEDLIGEGRDWGGKVGTGYDSMDKSWYGGAAVAKKIENTSIMFLGTYKKGHERQNHGSVGGFGPTRTATNPADYDQSNLLFKLRQDTESGHRFGFTAERFSTEKDIDLRQAQTLTGTYRPGNHESGEENRRTRVSLDYEYDAPSTDGLIDAAQATLYWQRQERALTQDSFRFTTVPGVYTRDNQIEEAGVGFTGFLDNNFRTGTVDHVFTLGTNLFLSRAEQYSAGVDSCPAAPPYVGVFAGCAMLHTNQADMPDVDSTKIGIYAQDRMTFGDSGFSLTPGLRFDWYDHSPRNTPSFTNNASNPSMPGGSQDSALSPKLLAEYQLNDDVTLFAQWAMGFRSPTATELYLSYGSVGSYASIGNPDLEPETSSGFEVGSRLGDDNFGGSVNFFYTRYKNFIDGRNLTAAEITARGLNPLDYQFFQQQINLSKVEIFGAEFSAHKRFDSGFNVRAGLAFTRGIDLVNHTHLASVAPVKAIVGAGYETETWGVDVLWTGVGNVSYKSSATYKAAGYGLVDLTTWWEPEQIKGLRINAGIYNLLDKKYWDALNNKGTTVPPATADYYSEPGRTFKLSLTQRF
jgi:hemoglobin/transferrin/lactoferrin receptor protein